MINIISGYFAAFHKGHKQYLNSAIKDSPELLIVIVQDDKQQKDKYGLCAVSVSEIVSKIQNYYNEQDNIKTKLMILINHHKSVADMFFEIRKSFPDDKITFCKDGDRDINNLPEDEIQAMKENCIDYQFLGNQKIMSSSEILKAIKH